jgi:hypothetical protein
VSIEEALQTLVQAGLAPVFAPISRSMLCSLLSGVSNVALTSERKILRKLFSQRVLVTLAMALVVVALIGAPRGLYGGESEPVPGQRGSVLPRPLLALGV